MLLKLSKYFLYASVFCVVIVLTGTFFPFIGGKDYFFRAAVDFSLIFLLLHFGFEEKKDEVVKDLKKLFSQPLVLAVSAFVFMFLLASIFAYDAHAAFWSNFERGEGGFQMLHYYVFFLLLIFLFRAKEEWQTLFKLSLVAAVLMIGYGLLAAGFVTKPIFFIGPYKLPSGQPTAPTFFSRIFSPSRFQGSLGNPAYVAPYLIFAIFYALWLWIKSRSPKTDGWIYGPLVAIFLLFFALSETRGAFVGLALGILAFLLYIAFRNPRWRKVSLVLFFLFVIFSGTLVAFRHSDFVKNLPGGRLFDIAFSDQTVQTRLWTWGSAWQGFLERPLLGWGPENFTTVFDKHFNPKHFVPGANSETWFDRAHSIVFDYLAETGLLGFLSYLGMFIVFYWEFFKTRIDADKKLIYADKKPVSISQNQHKSVLSNALLFSLPIAYLVQGLVLFDVLPIYINLFLFLAFAVFVFNSKDSAPSKQTNQLTN